MSEPFAIAKTARGDEVFFRPALANRHGLITGATGTGKTVTLQMLTDHFSSLGVPVFLADVKGDLSGLAAAGSATAKLKERLQRTGIAEPHWAADPVVFWDVFGKRGFPLRATISDLGPLLIGRLFNLNPTQQGVLALVFRIADDRGLLLLDLKDLRAMLTDVGNDAKRYRTEYGNISTASIGAIQRSLLEVEQQGGSAFFGEPMLNVDDLLQTDARGRGTVHVLSAEELIRAPKVYATFLLWLLSELFEQLPEVGDPDKPILVFFFDEAHLLFDDAPEALIEKIEQVVRLIRSKGVGVYFVTQNPADVPETVLGQLGNRVQHALRAFTPRDQKAVKVAAETLRPNPAIDTARAISELAVGEALVSLLDEHGSPTITERAWILPPASQIGPVSDAERKATHEANKAFYGEYEQTIDRESAYERLTGRTASRAASVSAPAAAGAPASSTGAGVPDAAAPTEVAAQAGPPPLPPGPRKQKAEPRVETAPEPPSAPQRSEPWAQSQGGQAGSESGLTGALSDFLFGRTGPRGGHYDGVLEAAGKSAARSMGSGIGRAILRGALGSIVRSR
ncbi:MAG TPA: helicase HerA-like domain-containing protein [Vicinamibacterales bacterium]|nr:helicase HerA-like domain-containing protein [Vicinamibacterales bacterium]